MDKRHLLTVLGLGFMGATHIETLGTFDHPFNIIGYDTRIEACDEIKKKYPDITVTTSLDEVFSANPTHAIVVTHGPSHADLVYQCAEHGVPAILCEKPMTTNIAAALKMLDVCKKNGSSLFMNFPLRLVPRLAHIREILQSEKLGKLVNMTAVIGGARGMGCVGSHYVDLMHWFSNSNATAVSGVLDTTGTPNKRGGQFVDPGGYAYFTFKNGMRAFLDMSEDFFLPPLITLYCTKGYVTGDLMGNDWRAYEYSEGTQVTAKEISKAAGFTELPLEPADGLDSTLIKTNAVALKTFFSATPHLATGEDGLRALEMILGIHASQKKSGEWVSLPLEESLHTLNVNFT